LAGNLAEKPLSVNLHSWNATGFTALGRSNVLCACIESAVNMRPEIVCGFAPRKSHTNSADWFGFRLQSETWIAPAGSRDAETLSPGIVSLPRV
jgi:hypothetical protein